MEHFKIKKNLMQENSEDNTVLVVTLLKLKVSPPFEGGVAGKLIIWSLQDSSPGQGG
jgi:hypothetical protein